MVSAYFKNVGQTRTLIQLLQERSAIQLQASTEMKEKFAHYNLELEEVLIGTPSSLRTTRKSRHPDATPLAADRHGKVETYGRQETGSRQGTRTGAKPRPCPDADSNDEAELNINIQTTRVRLYQRSIQQAAQIRALAQRNRKGSPASGIPGACHRGNRCVRNGGPQFPR